MQLFNQFNSRKLGLKEFNIFERFFNNFWFLIVIAGEFAASWFMVRLGDQIFRTTPLEWLENVVSLSFGIGCLIIGAILKAAPDTVVDKMPSINEDPADSNDIFSRLQNKFVGRERSETERLLTDSQ